MIPTLFDEILEQGALSENLGPGTAILRGFALEHESPLFDALFAVAARSHFRHMVTPGGFRMSVAITNCGSFGWITDRKGYRYDSIDPETQALWPPMPEPFMELAQSAAKVAGFPDFVSDPCLINRYEPGARLTLDQDKNERDFCEPIVSVSLALPAVFQFSGQERSDKTTRVRLVHGDVFSRFDKPLALRMRRELWDLNRVFRHGRNLSRAWQGFELTEHCGVTTGSVCSATVVR
jgi:alkylated DNA repair protein (DNA oxidative demethylase)